MNDVTLIQLKDLSEQLQEEVRRATADYIVPIVVNDVQIGSGTLVMIDDRPGILAAEHAVNASNKRFNLEQPNQHLRTAIADFAHDLAIPGYVLRIVKTKNVAQEYGPDLAFISLPPGPFLSELKGRKSFYSLTGRKEQSLAGAFADEGFFAVCGNPSIRNLDAVGEMGFSKRQYCGAIPFSPVLATIFQGRRGTTTRWKSIADLPMNSSAHSAE